jgi:4-diphosphocytidyl-2-C-methyl-D-erythritol kinase
MSGGAARAVAHAKINLALRVLARGGDGYHAIETVFARLALGDDVAVRALPSGRSIDCRGADAGPSEQNLALRAAAAYAHATGWPAGFAIEIEKRIPVGGGLGGGSADAGAVLRLLDALAPRPVGQEGLLALAMGLGSDVPYLTTTDPVVFAWGRGEKMRALPPLAERSVVLVFPGFAVDTTQAYRWLDEDREQVGTWAPAHLHAGRLSRWSDVAELAENDFEEPVGRRHPEVARVIERLREAGGAIALLSGSGSTVFGIFEEPPDAGTIARAVPYRHELTSTLVRVTAVERID